MCDFPAPEDFPAPDELEDYYVQQFQDELQLIRESDQQYPSPSKTTDRNECNQVRRSLDFSSERVREAGETGSKRTRRADTEVHGSKRHKPDGGAMLDEDALLELRILESRRRRAVPRSRQAAASDDAHSPHRPTDNLSYTIPRWPFTSVTRADGQRVYVRVETEGGAGAGEVSAPARGGECNLEAHLRNLYATIWPEANCILESKRGSVRAETADMETGVERRWGDGAQLLVDRYRPRVYTELLSEEADNRAVLHWLKLWDKIVFNRDVKLKDAPKPTSFSRRAGTWVSGAGRDGGTEKEAEVDGAGRPQRRVLLLAGPPGAGKTTLAHLLASHAGYRPLEVNASDERSVDAFRTVLHNATEMQATLDRDRRPNCVILDEIDGAPQPTVEFLVKFVSGTESRGGKTSKGHSHRPPCRPIICICNDLWTPALRPLRAVAAVVSVSGASAARVAARLGEVAAREGLRLEGGALGALVARAGGDVRAGLAALHMLSARVATDTTREVRTADVERVCAAGSRDTREGLLQVLRRLLTPGGSSLQLVRAVSALGDYDRLAAGVHENMVSAGCGSVAGAARALDALRWLDRLQTHVACSQQYALYPHLAPALLAARRLLPPRRTRAAHLAFPTRDLEVRRETERAAAVCAAVRRGSAAQLLPFLSHAALALDLIPLLPHLISPNLPSHNIQLYSAAKRCELGAAARVMCDYALQYEQSKAADNTYHYALQPDILRVAFYGEAGGRVRRLGYAVQQTLAREVQLEMMRRTEVKVNPTTTQRARPAAAAAVTETAVEASAPQLPNHLQRLHAKPLDPAVLVKPHVVKDMFGRAAGAGRRTAGAAAGAAAALAGGAAGAAGSGAGAGCSLYYHYREGYNNAVRRAVKLHDLL